VELTDRDTGQMVAVVHRFRDYMGSLGASGRPDPKRVWMSGEWYYSLKRERSD